MRVAERRELTVEVCNSKTVINPGVDNRQYAQQKRLVEQAQGHDISPHRQTTRPGNARSGHHDWQAHALYRHFQLAEERRKPSPTSAVDDDCRDACDIHVSRFVDCLPASRDDGVKLL